MSIEPASYTSEKFELFKEYQACVHKDEEKEPASFKRFLCDTCLSVGGAIANCFCDGIFPSLRSVSSSQPTPIPYTRPPARSGHLPVNYGTHHQLYRLNGELVAMATLDILPGCVSSVYFMYSNQWAWLQLGRVSLCGSHGIVASNLVLSLDWRAARSWAGTRDARGWSSGPKVVIHG